MYRMEFEEGHTDWRCSSVGKGVGFGGVMERVMSSNPGQSIPLNFIFILPKLV